jgi:hypothetical protein
MDTRELAIEAYCASQVGGTAQPRKRKLRVSAAKAPRKRKGASQKAWLADVDVDANGARSGAGAAAEVPGQRVPGGALRGVLHGSWPTLAPFLGGRDVMLNAVPTATHAIARTARAQLFTGLLSFATASGWDSPAFLAREARDAARQRARDGAVGAAAHGAALGASPGALHAARLRSPRRADEEMLIDESSSESGGGRLSGGEEAPEKTIDADEEEVAAAGAALDAETDAAGVECAATLRLPSRRVAGAKSAARGASEEQRLRTPLAADFAQMSVSVPLSPQRHAPQRKRGARCCMLARRHLGPCIHGDVERENVSPVEDVGRAWRRAERGARPQRARLPLPPRAAAPASAETEGGLAQQSPALVTKTRVSAPLLRGASVGAACSSPALREISLGAAASVIRTAEAKATVNAQATAPLACVVLRSPDRSPARSPAPAKAGPRPNALDASIGSVASARRDRRPSATRAAPKASARFDLGLDDTSSSEDEQGESRCAERAAPAAAARVAEQPIDSGLDAGAVNTPGRAEEYDYDDIDFDDFDVDSFGADKEAAGDDGVQYGVEINVEVNVEANVERNVGDESDGAVDDGGEFGDEYGDDFDDEALASVFDRLDPPAAAAAAAQAAVAPPSRPAPSPPRSTARPPPPHASPAARAPQSSPFDAGGVGLTQMLNRSDSIASNRTMDSTNAGAPPSARAESPPKRLKLKRARAAKSKASRRGAEGRREKEMEEKKRRRKKKKKKKGGRGTSSNAAALFFEREAQLSGSDHGGDVDGGDLDVDLSGFINNDSQDLRYESALRDGDGAGAPFSPDAIEREAHMVSCILCTVTFHANHAHNLTRSP